MKVFHLERLIYSLIEQSKYLIEQSHDISTCNSRVLSCIHPTSYFTNSHQMELFLSCNSTQRTTAFRGCAPRPPTFIASRLCHLPNLSLQKHLLPPLRIKKHKNKSYYAVGILTFYECGFMIRVN